RFWERNPIMMRKDVKVGFVVGGILVAVLIAVALVSGPKKPPAGGADLASGENSSGDQSTAPGNAAPSAADTSAARSAEGPSPTTSPSDPFKPSDATVAQANPTEPKRSSEPSAEDKWMMALNNGVMPMMTTNPAPAGSARGNSGAPAPDVPLGPERTQSLRARGTGIVPDGNPATQPASRARTHVVQQYETLSTIAAAAYGNANFYPYIQRANPT